MFPPVLVWELIYHIRELAASTPVERSANPCGHRRTVNRNNSARLSRGVVCAKLSVTPESSIRDALSRVESCPICAAMQLLQ